MPVTFYNNVLTVKHNKMDRSTCLYSKASATLKS